MKRLIEAEPSPFAFNAAGREIEIIDVRHASGAVHPYGSFEGMIGTAALRPDLNAVIAFLDALWPLSCLLLCLLHINDERPHLAETSAVDAASAKSLSVF